MISSKFPDTLISLSLPCVDFQLRNQITIGGFGPWAAWQQCSYDDGEGTSTCLCRSRECDNPPARCGGRNCEGPTIEVSNCSRYVKQIGIYIDPDWRIADFLLLPSFPAGFLENLVIWGKLVFFQPLRRVEDSRLMVVQNHWLGLSGRC